jgi:hypothetical protein
MQRHIVGTLTPQIKAIIFSSFAPASASAAQHSVLDFQGWYRTSYWDYERSQASRPALLVGPPRGGLGPLNCDWHSGASFSLIVLAKQVAIEETCEAKDMENFAGSSVSNVLQS